MENLKPQLQGANTAQFIDSLFLRGRYLHIPCNATLQAPPPTGTGSDEASAESSAESPALPRVYCEDASATAQVLDAHRAVLTSTLQQLKRVFVRLHEVAGGARFENYLADYWETVIQQVVGAHRVKDFLMDFAYC